VNGCKNVVSATQQSSTLKNQNIVERQQVLKANGTLFSVTEQPTKTRRRKILRGMIDEQDNKQKNFILPSFLKAP
jgi:hypothetical protein